MRSESIRSLGLSKEAHGFRPHTFIKRLTFQHHVHLHQSQAVHRLYLRLVVVLDFTVCLRFSPAKLFYHCDSCVLSEPV